jgi:hypothetical protein
MDIYMDNITNTTICCYAVKANNKGLRSFGSWKPGFSSVYVQNIKKDIYIIVDTEIIGNTDKYYTYLNTLPNSSAGNKPTLIVIKPTTKKKYNQDEIDYLINEFGNPNHKTAAELNIVKDKKIGRSTTYVKRDNTERLVWNGFTTKDTKYYDNRIHRKYNKNCWYKQIIDVSEGGFYVPIHRWEVQCKNPTYFDNVIINAVKLGLLDKTTKVYGFNEAEVKDAMKYNNWVNVLDYCEEQFHILNHDGALTNTKVIDNMVSTIGGNFVNVINSNWDNINDMLVDGHLKTFLIKFMTIKYNSNQYNTGVIELFMSSLNLSSPTSSKLLKELQTEWSKLYDRYPMLGICPLYNISQYEQAVKILQYTNDMENLLTLKEESSKI